MNKSKKGKSGKFKGRNGKNPFTKRQESVESADMKGTKFDSNDDRPGDYHTGKPNDWRWYAMNAQLVKDYASYPFGFPTGIELQTGVTSIDNNSVPGVMGIYFQPTIGNASVETDPINVAMRRLYSFVRHANSGATNYDAPDLMLYLLAVDSALMFHSYMKRLYGVLMDYTAENRYYPNALIYAMGCNPDDLSTHINDFRGYINQYAVRLAQLWIPNSMSYMARHSWMCEGIYTDSTSAKAQTYLYVPASFYKFMLTNDGVGMLQPTTWVSSGSSSIAPGKKFQDIVQFGNDLLAPMISNEDFGIMSGDILKAFGESGIVKVQGITEGYQILPVYDEEVLSQIENMTVLGTGTSGTPVMQATAVGTGYLTQQPVFAKTIGMVNTPVAAALPSIAYQAGIPLTMNKFLNFHHSSPTPEEVMVATRLMASQSSTITATNQANNVTVTFKPDVIGSEVIIAANMYYFNTNSGDRRCIATQVPSSFIIAVGNDIENATNTARLGNFQTTLCYLSQFDWHHAVYPVLLISNADGEVNFSSSSGLVIDLDNYTMLNIDNIKNMHTTALLSEFSVPMIG